MTNKIKFGCLQNADVEKRKKVWILLIKKLIIYMFSLLKNIKNMRIIFYWIFYFKTVIILKQKRRPCHQLQTTNPNRQFFLVENHYLEHSRMTHVFLSVDMFSFHKMEVLNTFWGKCLSMFVWDCETFARKFDLTSPQKRDDLDQLFMLLPPTEQRPVDPGYLLYFSGMRSYPFIFIYIAIIGNDKDPYMNQSLPWNVIFRCCTLN